MLSYYFALKGKPIVISNSPTEEEPFYPTGALAYPDDKHALMHQDGGHQVRYSRVLEFLRANWQAPEGRQAL